MKAHVAGLDGATPLSPLFVLRGSYGQVGDACFLRDGRMAVRVAPYVHVASAATGELLETMIPAATLSEFAASRDGNVLAFVDSLGKISTSRGTSIDVRDEIADPRAFTRIALDGTGARAVAVYGNAAAVFDLRTGAALSDLRGHRAQPAQERGEPYDAAYVASVAVSADGTLAVTGGTDETAIVWDTATGAALHVLGSHEGTVSRVAIDPNARTIATTDSMRVLRTWDAKTGRCLLRHAVDDRGAIALAFDAGGERLAVLFSEGTLALFYRHQKATLAWWQPSVALAGPVPYEYNTSIAFDPSGTNVLIAGPRDVAPSGGWFDDSCVRIVDVKSRAAREYRYESGWPVSLSMSADGATVMAGGVRAQRWDASDGRTLDATKFPASWQLTYAPGGRRLAAVLASGAVVILDDSGAALANLDPTVLANTASWTPDGKHLVLVTGVSEDPLVVCDASTGAVTARPLGRKRVDFYGFGDDGTLVFGDRDGLDAFEPQSWTKRWTLSGPIELCAFASSSPFFFVGDGTSGVAVRDVATGKLRKTLDVGERPGAIVAAPSGTWVVTSGDGPLRVWSVERARVVATLDGLIEVRGLSIAFSSDERRIAVNLGTTRDFGSAAIFDMSNVRA